MLAMAAALIIPCTEVSAHMPYETYSYNYWGEAVAEPPAYLYGGSIQTAEGLNFPQDMCMSEGALFVADTGHSRILKLTVEGDILMILDEADGMPLNAPQGVYVTDEGHIYVADSDNARVVEYTGNGEFIRSIGRPETSLLSVSQEYKPIRVAVDKAGRIYVIAYGINMGLVEFDRNGVFQGFMGATEVSVSRLTYIWKNYFSTKEQQNRMKTIVPTEYSDIFVDDENFIYATISNLTDEDLRSGADAVRRLNPTGTDVLRRLSDNDIIGDIGTGVTYSAFADVAATSYGCYYCVDSLNGKIFAYDYDGNSLFVFGRKGSKNGNFTKPVALAADAGEETVYVLDNVLGEILYFNITEYGRALMEAIRLNDRGDSEGSTAMWREVLRYNSNSELAYIGLGKAALAYGDYREAMEDFRLGNSRKYYDKAFFYYRKERMEENFGRIMSVIITTVAVILIVVSVGRFRRWREKVRSVMAMR